MLLLRSDGGARGNPGPAGAGFVLEDSSGNEVEQGSEFLGKATNNEAEYQALILGMRAAQKHSPRELRCFLDSQLVVNQLNGLFRIKKAHLAKLVVKVRELERGFKKVEYHYVPREQNGRADKLVNKAIDEVLAD
ncbi:ribonuclease HI family protein [Candidatus Parcubacteria bacterium]|nr:ribonuclease HI family protein [Candidatus Parcubacteria bacterium]